MKKTIRLLLVAIIATAMVTFAGCEEEGDPVVVNNGGNNGNNGGGGNENDTTAVEWVDLGLPSGLLWASCNVGATNPEDYGDYFAWGETQPKSDYSWCTYRYCTVDAEGKLDTLTKYNIDKVLGTVDGLITLQPEDDAATARMGNGARTPTYDEWEELLDNTTWEVTTLNGVDGEKFSAANGKSIFLPAADNYYYGSELNYAGNRGGYWSATLEAFSRAWCLHFRTEYVFMTTTGVSDRCNGLSVRAVRDRQK